MEANAHSLDGELPGIPQTPSPESLIAEVDWGVPEHADSNEPLTAEIPQEHASAADDTSQPDAAREQEELARQHGWVEKEKYHGRAPWVDAETFNMRREVMMPHILREAKTLRSVVEQRDQVIADMRAQLEALTKHQQEQQAAAASIQYQTLQAQKAQAESEGDWQTAAKIGDKLTEIAIDRRLAEKLPLPKQPQGPAQVDPEVVQVVKTFTDANPIYRDQQMLKKLWLEAGAVKAIYIQNNIPFTRDELLAEAHDRVKALYPDQFKSRSRGVPMAEMNGAPARSTGGTRGYQDLTQAELTKAQNFFNTTPMFKKLDAKQLAAAKADYLSNLPATAFRR